MLYFITTLAALAGNPPFKYKFIDVTKSPSLSLISAALGS